MQHTTKKKQTIISSKTHKNFSNEVGSYNCSWKNSTAKMLYYSRELYYINPYIHLNSIVRSPLPVFPWMHRVARLNCAHLIVLPLNTAL